MAWIVLGEEKGKIKLVSKNDVPGLLPKGAYLTIEEGKTKFILRIDESVQKEPYSPSPMLADMDLSPLRQDQKCQNIITAYRVKDLTERTDGYIEYIRPQSIARRSTQEEINSAIGSDEEGPEVSEGPEVFIATVHSGQNQILMDDECRFITAKLPISMFYHQMLVCGKTGLGKTVATKYLAQYFVEKLEGAVLAINVKDVDFLKMDKPSEITNPSVSKEWEMINKKPHGIDNFVIYYPANTEISLGVGVNQDLCEKTTLNVREIEPEALTGLLQGISDIGAQNLPNIFRYWKEDRKEEGMGKDFTFSNFVDYFSKAEMDGRLLKTLNTRGEEGEITIHKGTFDNILRNLDVARDFFDNEGATPIDETDILVSGKMSIINVSGDRGIQFGSILLRHLLRRIVSAKSEQKSDVPILIIIDEVHQFYDTNASRETLGALNRICRTGRSQEIGIIFSSQNPEDIPTGLSRVINTKIFFKSDMSVVRQHGITLSAEEMGSLKIGFAAVSIHDLSQIKIIKFPMAFAGVVKRGDKNGG